MRANMKENIIFPPIGCTVRLHIDPQFDSPIEEVFAYHFDKYKNEEAVLHQQVQVNTICGPYWLDFVATINDKIVGIECDGKDYHDTNRDFWRDSMILGTGAVDSIYRFSGRDLNYHVNDCLFLLSEVEPEIFSKRGIINLSHLSSAEAREADDNEKYLTEDGLAIFYRKEIEEESRVFDTFIYVKRRNKKVSGKKDPDWVKYYNFAKEHGGGNLNEIIESYDSSSKDEEHI